MTFDQFMEIVKEEGRSVAFVYIGDYNDKMQDHASLSVFAQALPEQEELLRDIEDYLVEDKGNRMTLRRRISDAGLSAHVEYGLFGLMNGKNSAVDYLVEDAGRRRNYQAMDDIYKAMRTEVDRLIRITHAGGTYGAKKRCSPDLKTPCLAVRGSPQRIKLMALLSCGPLADECYISPCPVLDDGIYCTCHRG